jgi:hypothetical protein
MPVDFLEDFSGRGDMPAGRAAAGTGSDQQMTLLKISEGIIQHHSLWFCVLRCAIAWALQRGEADPEHGKWRVF